MTPIRIKITHHAIQRTRERMPSTAKLHPDDIHRLLSGMWKSGIAFVARTAYSHMRIATCNHTGERLVMVCSIEPAHHVMTTVYTVDMATNNLLKATRGRV